jgi:anti-sigma regulatory factor (Ser/Thr protein kinase)
VGPVTVVFAVDAERLEIHVEDEGGGLDRIPADDQWSIPEHLEGGMGMAIISAIVDELEVDTGADGRGTIVRMTKYLAPRSS